MQATHYSTIVSGIYQWLVDIPNKGPTLRKTSEFHNVIGECEEGNEHQLQWLGPWSHKIASNGHM